MMMSETLYRTRTYIAADFDNDHDAVNQLYKWNNDPYSGISFTSAHDLQTSRDSSLPCSIKQSLQYRMSGSNTFVLIVGEHTNAVTKGGCQYCDSYDSYSQICRRGYSVDYRSYIKFECDLAVKAYQDKKMRIIVLYKDILVDKSKCPEAVRYLGTHVHMLFFHGGECCWDYFHIEQAFNDL